MLDTVNHIEPFNTTYIYTQTHTHTHTCSNIIHNLHKLAHMQTTQDQSKQGQRYTHVQKEI